MTLSCKLVLKSVFSLLLPHDLNAFFRASTSLVSHCFSIVLLLISVALLTHLPHSLLLA